MFLQKNNFLLKNFFSKKFFKEKIKKMFQIGCRFQQNQNHHSTADGSAAPACLVLNISLAAAVPFFFGQKRPPIGLAAGKLKSFPVI